MMSWLKQANQFRLTDALGHVYNNVNPGPDVEVLGATLDWKCMFSARCFRDSSGEFRDDGVGEGDDVGFDGLGGAS